MFLFFSVARSANTSQAERAKEATATEDTAPLVSGIELGNEAGEKMPTDKLLDRSEEHTSELQSRQYLVCRLLLEKIHQHVCLVQVAVLQCRVGVSKHARLGC